MSILSSMVGILALLSGLFTPASAMAALGTSFGGRVISVTPCAGGLNVVIQPAGFFQPAYVWTAGTIGLPPVHPGQYILGVADIPTFGIGGCFGQRIQYDGVSL